MARFVLPWLLIVAAFPGLALAQAKAAKKQAAKKETARPIDPKGLAFFESKIRPVLVKNCYQCHSAGAKEVQGGFLLDTRDGLLKGGKSGPAIVPGDENDSLIMEALRHEGLEMPPSGKLDREVIDAFAAWIRMGAPDPRTASAVKKTPVSPSEARKFWAFQMPKKSAAPSVEKTAWPRNDIDHFVLAAMEKEGLKLVADAERSTLIRRVSFALTGLPPTHEEIREFVNDQSPPADALAKVIDGYLASPHFGERWGRHWLDVARYAESTGMERNRLYPQAWRYRDYVIDSFNEDKPYDKFILEQIAGDLLPATSEAQRNENLIATGFLALGPKGLNERNREKFLMDVVDDQIDASTRAIMGLTVACARCHDHKFDPIPTTDYYALAGIFRSTETLAGVGSGPAKVQNTGDLMPLASVTDGKKQSPADIQKIRTLEKELQEARSQLQDAQGKTKKNKKAKKNAEKPALAQLRREVTRIEGELSQLRGGASGSSEMAMAVRDSSSPADCQVCVRGEVTERGPRVERGFVSVLSPQKPQIKTGASGRLELARWFASKSNPLTARVMVNRIWHHLFGAGLVESTDNFGALGDKPTHPQLLDMLAVQFMADNWSVKKTIRRIMLSRAYGLSSQHDAANFELDPENRYLWRMTRHRLEAEAIRDAILAASGQLDPKRPQGSPVTSLGNGEIGRQVRPGDMATNSRHRSVYLPILRQAMPDVLTLFDAADPSLVVGSRDATTVATQALFMMNSPFVQQNAQKLAERLLAQTGASDAARVAMAYELTLTRLPSQSELNRALIFLREYEPTASGTNKTADAWAGLCQVLFGSAEFRYAY